MALAALVLGGGGSAQAFDAVMIPPSDPRPMEELLAQYDQAGRIVRLRQGFENATAPEVSFAVAAFRTPDNAAAAVKDPQLLAFVLPDAPPKVSVGYHLYADADGAREALGASPAEMALRVNEEFYLLDALYTSKPLPAQ